MIGLFQAVRRAIGSSMRLVALLQPKIDVSVNCVIPCQAERGHIPDLGDAIR
jgi:hypothetical protein